jgi:hypothetical protein
LQAAAEGWCFYGEHAMTAAAPRHWCCALLLQAGWWLPAGGLRPPAHAAAAAVRGRRAVTAAASDGRRARINAVHVHDVGHLPLCNPTTTPAKHRDFDPLSHAALTPPV